MLGPVVEAAVVEVGVPLCRTRFTPTAVADALGRCAQEVLRLLPPLRLVQTKRQEMEKLRVTAWQIHAVVVDDHLLAIEVRPSVALPVAWMQSERIGEVRLHERGDVVEEDESRDGPEHVIETLTHETVCEVVLAERGFALARQIDQELQRRCADEPTPEARTLRPFFDLAAEQITGSRLLAVAHVIAPHPEIEGDGHIEIQLVVALLVKKDADVGEPVVSSPRDGRAVTHLLWDVAEPSHARGFVIDVAEVAVAVLEHGDVMGMNGQDVLGITRDDSLDACEAELLPDPGEVRHSFCAHLILR